MFKPAGFNIQHLNSNREDFFAFILFFYIKLQEKLIKFQHAQISKSYLKFWHVPELSHSVHRGINPTQKLPPSYFLPRSQQIAQALIFRQFLIYIFFCDLAPSGKNWWASIISTFFIFNAIRCFKSNKILS